jgi:hypothetical protein
MAVTWTLRSASNLDREFLYRLYSMTMREVVDETWGWDEDWQRKDFEKRFREAPFYASGLGSG